MAGAGFRIETHIGKELPDILADRETLGTAIHNLLDNAVKYSGKSKTVQVEASAHGNDLSISVRDYGVGICEEDRARIFERFYRGGGELTRQVKGVGLGLNLVQNVVTAHHGTIDYESTPDEGCRFTIRMPGAKQT